MKINELVTQERCSGVFWLSSAAAPVYIYIYMEASLKMEGGVK